MKLRVLGAYGGELGSYRNSSYLFEDARVLLDAGCASQVLTVEEIRKLRAVVLTHPHADHISSLPFMLDVRIGAGTLDVYALRETIAALRIHIFNNKIWPDFERIPDPRHPLLRYHEIEREKPLDLDDLRFTPVPVDHTVPTVGYVIENGKSSVVFSSDTGPTRRIWEVAARTENLKAVIVEVSFPERLDRISTLSKHLSTVTIRDELAKLPQAVPTFLNHLKPAFLEELHRELAPIMAERANVRLLDQDLTYDF
jgi:ribonuclease BN (tRNA processing enzyme)